MKKFLKESFGTDNIEQINQDELKKVLQNDHAPLISRMKYRKNATTSLLGGKKKVEIGKGQKLTLQHAMVEGIQDKSTLNEFYGFRCLHYSVSEASEKLDVLVFNKSGKAGSVKVVTKENDAKEGKDFHKLDELL